MLWVGRFDKHALISINLAVEDINLRCQGAALLPTMATKGYMSAMVSFLSDMVKPR
jgi:hypothetical protein